MKKSRFLSLLLTLVMLMSMTGFGAEAAEGGKYTTETTEDGWIKVVNDGGATLGYSPDSGVTIIEDDGYAFKDLNKNGKIDAYEDWRLDFDARAKDAAAQLSNDEMTALLLLGTDSSGSTSAEIPDDVKALLTSGFRSLTEAPSGSVSGIVAYSNKIQAYVEGIGIGVPIDTQGEPSLSETTAWPTNVALSATFDPNIVLEYGKIRGQEYRAIGITSANMPQIDLATEPRWMRIEGTFSEDPALCADMAESYVNGLQSTFDKDGNDLGWGEDSVAAYVKHFPGDGAGESGRESHSFSGKYNVKSGGQMKTHLIPFISAFDLDGKTKSAVGVMPSYSIGLDENGEPLGGERVGSGYSNYDITQLLRGQLGFDGVVVSDYGVIGDFAPWGAEKLSEDERCLMMIEAGTDKAGSYTNLDAMKAGAKLYGEKHGEEALHTRLTESAVRIMRNMFKLGLFDNPYLIASESEKKIGTAEQKKASEQAQLKSVVMLKNSDSLIRQSDGSKRSIYIPLEYSAATEASSGGPFSVSASPAAFKLPVDVAVASKYFNIVTDKVSDTLTGPTDENGKATVSENDVIRASEEELAACDFALAVVDSPLNLPAYMGKGYNQETGEYIPISLQYGPYTADSKSVRKESISGDVLDDGTKENRSYFGKSANVANAKELDKILDLTSKVKNVVVVVNATNPMVFSEFESKVDSILIQFGGVEDKAIFEILSGKVEPSGLLPLQMPANMETVEAQYEDVPRDMECHVDADGNTYDFAYGMNWSGVIDDARVEKYSVAPLEG